MHCKHFLELSLPKSLQNQRAQIRYQTVVPENLLRRSLQLIKEPTDKLILNILGHQNSIATR
jgi:hypothetical protein